MHEYELMYILHPRLTADEAGGAIERVSTAIAQRGGELLTSENWGRRRLSYPIQHNFEGTYVLATLKLPPEAAAPLEAGLRISEDVIRHLLIRGIIPYEGPPAHDERSRGPRAAASDSPEAVEESANDAGPAAVASDADAEEPTPAGASEAGEAAPAAPPESGGGDSEAGSEADEPRSPDEAGSAD